MACIATRCIPLVSLQISPLASALRMAFRAIAISLVFIVLFLLFGVVLSARYVSKYIGLMIVVNTTNTNKEKIFEKNSESKKAR
jgi:hypothetical protein